MQALRRRVRGISQLGSRFDDPDPFILVNIARIVEDARNGGNRYLCALGYVTNRHTHGSGPPASRGQAF